jgi:hypothetical protein
MGAGWPGGCRLEIGDTVPMHREKSALPGIGDIVQLLAAASRGAATRSPYIVRIIKRPKNRVGGDFLQRICFKVTNGSAFCFSVARQLTIWMHSNQGPLGRIARPLQLRAAEKQKEMG